VGRQARTGETDHLAVTTLLDLAFVDLGRVVRIIEQVPAGPILPREPAPVEPKPKPQPSNEPAQK